ncbi:cytochrome P450 2C38-like [Haemaphysalis longicornis]
MEMLWSAGALLACLMCAILCILVATIRRQCNFPQGSRCPPQPPQPSFRGHLQVNEPDFHRVKAIKWARTYGPVYRLKVNFIDVVVLNDMTSIQNFSNKNELLYRSRYYIMWRECYKGLGWQNGDVWKANKRFCMSTLRDLGFAKSPMENQMTVEIGSLVQHIQNTNGRPVYTQKLLWPVVVNNVAWFFYGSGGQVEKDVRHALTKLLEKARTVFREGAPFVFLPWPLLRLLEYVPGTRQWRLHGVMCKVEKMVIKLIENYSTTTDATSREPFVEKYMKKIEEANRSPGAPFQYRYLVGNVKTFFIAGTFNLITSMTGHFVNFAINERTVQAKVQQEIDNIVGPHRAPTWDDRKRMPYTLACLWEMERWHTQIPLGFPREAAEDIVDDGFYIAKGTAVLLNLWAVNNDPAHWKEPERFDPSRFLGEDGSISTEKLERVLSFSFGRRSCPAEIFSMMEIFLVVTGLLQKFRVILADPLPQDLEDALVAVQKSEQIRLRFLSRDAGSTSHCKLKET